MKIGLLTFHTAANYGAFLQTFALKTFIESMDIDNNYDVEVVNYRPTFLAKFDHNRLQDYDSFRVLLKMIHLILNKSNKKQIFIDFEKKYLDIAPKYGLTSDQLSAISKNYNAIIVGSDQVWNLKLTHNDYTYMLPNTAKECIKASYAASVGNFNINNDATAIKFLNDFQFVSFREKETQNGLLGKIKKNTYTHLDPTLLLEKKEWELFARKAKERTKPYILIYAVKPSIKLVESAIKFAKEKGIEIVQIQDEGRFPEIEYLKNQSPKDFLMLFKNASYVYTNSFHGTAFSVIFKKKFTVEIEANDGTINTRVLNLLEILGLKQCILMNNKEFMPEIQWDQVRDILEEERARSISYLNTIINYKNNQ